MPKKVTVIDIVKAQTEYIETVVKSMKKLDWKNMKIEDISYNFPVYVLRVLENLAVLNRALIEAYEKGKPTASRKRSPKVPN